MGHVLRVPYSIIEDLDMGMKSLNELGFTTIALTPDNKSLSIDQSLELGVKQPALLLGAEGPGLLPTTMEAADQCVRIETTNDVDSLNIAVAAAVSMHRYFDPV